MSNIKTREKKSFLGECETKDQPSDFPVQIADEINKIFNNLFTINVVEVVKHCLPYIRFEITGNRYKIISGTGYEAEMTFENLKIRDARTGRKAKVRNFSLKLPEDPNYEKEREQILETVDKYCKELVFLNRSRFEIAEVAVRMPTEQTDKKPKKSKKELKEEMKNKKEESA